MTLDFSIAESLTAEEFEAFYLPSQVMLVEGKMKVRCECGEDGTFDSLKAVGNNFNPTYCCPSCDKQLEMIRQFRYTYRVAKPDFNAGTIKEILFHIEQLKAVEKKVRESSFTDFSKNTEYYCNYELTDLAAFKSLFSEHYGYNLEYGFGNTPVGIVRRYTTPNEARRFAKHLEINGYTNLADKLKNYSEKGYGYTESEARKFRVLYGKKGTTFSFPTWLLDYLHISQWNQDTIDKFDTERKLVKKHNLSEEDYRTYKLLSLQPNDTKNFNSLLSKGYEFSELISYIAEQRSEGVLTSVILTDLRSIAQRTKEEDKDKIFYEKYPVNLGKYQKSFSRLKCHSKDYINNIADKFRNRHGKEAYYSGIVVKPITSEFELFDCCAAEKMMFCSSASPYLYSISFVTNRGKCLLGVFTSNSDLVISRAFFQRGSTNSIIDNALNNMGFTIDNA